MQIKSIMFDANVNLLTEKIEEFYVSPYFLTLHQNEQKELKLQLETLAKIRNSWIEILIEYYQPQTTTRMSPGDRMIWSDIAKQMNHKQQSNLIDASLYGIGIGCGPIPAGVVGAIAFAPHPSADSEQKAVIPQFVTSVAIPSTVSCPGHKKTGRSIGRLIDGRAKRTDVWIFPRIFIYLYEYINPTVCSYSRI